MAQCSHLGHSSWYRVNHQYIGFAPDVRLIEKHGSAWLQRIFPAEPNSSIFLSPLGLETVRLCTGDHTLESLVEDLAMAAPWAGETLVDETISLLADLSERGVVVVTENLAPRPIPAAAEPATSAPSNIALELTDACNLACLHCYLESGPQRTSYMPTPQLLGFLRGMSRYGIRTIHLTGGEPLLHEDFGTILEGAAGVAVSVVILTNGTLLSESLLDIISSIKEQLTIQIDLDGPSADVHDRLRGQAGAFDRVIHACTALEKRSIPFSIAFNAYRGNLDAVESTVALAERLGASSVMISPILALGRATDELVPDAVQLEQLVVTIRGLSERYPGLVRPPVPSLEAPRPNCGAGWRSVTISPRGDVRPCNLFPESAGSLGNIFDEPLDTVLSRPWFRRFHEITSPESEVCGACEHSIECRGCLARPVSLLEKILPADPGFVCRWGEETGFLGLLSDIRRPE